MVRSEFGAVRVSCPRLDVESVEDGAKSKVQ